MAKSKTKLALQLVDEMRSKGARGIYLGAELRDTFEHRLRSDSLGINAITRGGAPYNGITEIVGPPSSFKTTLALGFCKQAQKEHGNDTVIVWMTREGMLDINWARHNGVRIPYSSDEVKDLKKIGLDAKALKEFKTDQSSGGVFIVLADKSAESDLDRAKKLINSGAVSLFVLDSVGAMQSAAEQEASYEDAQVAVNPRLVSKVTRGVLSQCTDLANRGEETAFVLVNQVRAVIGGPPRGPKTSKPGGFAMAHNKHICLETRIVGLKRDSNNTVWAKEVAVKVDKSKICVPHRSCLFTFITRGDNPMNLPIGPDVYAEAAHMAADCELFKYQGNRWHYQGEMITIESVNEETGEVTETPAKKADLPRFLYSRPELLQEIQDEILHYHHSLEITGVPPDYWSQNAEEMEESGETGTDQARG